MGSKCPVQFSKLGPLHFAFCRTKKPSTRADRGFGISARRRTLPSHPFLKYGFEAISTHRFDLSPDIPQNIGAYTPKRVDGPRATRAAETSRQAFFLPMYGIIRIMSRRFLDFHYFRLTFFLLVLPLSFGFLSGKIGIGRRVRGSIAT